MKKKHLILILLILCNISYSQTFRTFNEQLVFKTVPTFNFNQSNPVLRSLYLDRFGNVVSLPFNPTPALSTFKAIVEAPSTPSTSNIANKGFGYDNFSTNRVQIFSGFDDNFSYSFNQPNNNFNFTLGFRGGAGTGIFSDRSTTGRSTIFNQTENGLFFETFINSKRNEINFSQNGLLLKGSRQTNSINGLFLDTSLLSNNIELNINNESANSLDITLPLTVNNQSATSNGNINLQEINYKSTTFRITQSGTNNPTLVVLGNTINNTLSITRDGVGQYLINGNPNTFTNGKTFIIPGTPPAPGIIYTMNYINSQSIRLITWGFTGSSFVTVDSQLNNTLLEIRIYN